MRKKLLVFLTLLFVICLSIFNVGCIDYAGNEPDASVGLEYQLSEDGTYYIVSSYGTCTDTKVVIPSTYKYKPVKEIGRYAFDHCIWITEITIPDSIINIQNEAFLYCLNLTEVTISNGATNIGYMSFYHCPELYTRENDLIYVKANGNPYCILYEVADKKLLTCQINNNTKYISTCAFQWFLDLTEVTMPDKLTSIGAGAFQNCWNLTEVTIPNSVISIGSSAFEHCWDLNEFTIPASVTSIGHCAFRHCSLTSVTFEDSANWYKTQNENDWKNKTGGTLIDLSNPITNANTFNSLTSYFDNYYLYKK